MNQEHTFSFFELALRYMHFYGKAISRRQGYGVHSPFAFGFLRDVIDDRKPFYAFPSIEKLRLQLLQNSSEIRFSDFGAGSRKEGSKVVRSVASIAKSSLKPPRYGRLLFRLADFLQPGTILELGTSLGVTTSYLAKACPLSQIYTFEGCEEVADIAQKNFRDLSLSNIHMIRGNFDDTLPEFIETSKNIDLAFVDGNHRYEPTLRYFQWISKNCSGHSVMVFDDIHWSSGMEKAWNEIRHSDGVTLSLDLFFMGLIFFRKEIYAPCHLSVRY